MPANSRRPVEDTEPLPDEAAPDGQTTILVRRGALRRFDAMKQKTADLPVVVDWDRRQGERRQPTADAPDERRAGERRRTPPFTWEAADFVVLPNPAAVDAPPATRSRRPKK
jgi:hypothetical protein